MSIQAYCEYNAGSAQRFVPHGTDLIDFPEPTHEGIELRQHATLGDFLRAINSPPPITGRVSCPPLAGQLDPGVRRVQPERATVT